LAAASQQHQQQQQQQPHHHQQQLLAGPQIPQQSSSSSKEHFDGGKVFVSGMSPYTDEVRMSAFFSQFGAVREARVMRDKLTHESRCFGFVTFVDDRVVDALVNGAELAIDGRAVQLKRALAMDATAPRHPEADAEQDELTLFIGRIPAHVTDVRLRDTFAQFANVDSAQVMKDRLSGASRGFGFVRFHSLTDVDSILRIHSSTPISIDQAEIKVIKAEPKPPKRDRVFMARQRQSRVQPYGPVSGMPMVANAGYGAAAAGYGGGYDYATAAAYGAAAQQQQPRPANTAAAAAAAASAQVYQQQLAAYQAYQQAVMTAYQQQQQQLLQQQQQQQQQQQRRK
jgi:RNA recognition motif-containing protein